MGFNSGFKGLIQQPKNEYVQTVGKV